MIFCSDFDYRSRRDVLASYFGAVRVVRVIGGWLVFSALTITRRGGVRDRYDYLPSIN